MCVRWEISLPLSQQNSSTSSFNGSEMEIPRHPSVQRFLLVELENFPLNPTLPRENARGWRKLNTIFSICFMGMQKRKNKVELLGNNGKKKLKKLNPVCVDC